MGVWVIWGLDMTAGRVGGVSDVVEARSFG